MLLFDKTFDYDIDPHAGSSSLLHITLEKHADECNQKLLAVLRSANGGVCWSFCLASIVARVINSSCMSELAGGVIPLPNTQTDGLSLVPTSEPQRPIVGRV